MNKILLVGVSALHLFMACTVVPQGKWLQVPAEPGAIYFYNKGEPYYDFTNFAQYPIKLDGRTWFTTEHYFQAQKFKHEPQIYKKIVSAPSARDAFNIAQANQSSIVRGWLGMRVGVMERAVLAKFMQYPALRALLLGTGTKVLVEDTKYATKPDDFWGAGVSYNGENQLGEILMRVRQVLRTSGGGGAAVGPSRPVVPTPQRPVQPVQPVRPIQPAKTVDPLLGPQSIKSEIDTYYELEEEYYKGNEEVVPAIRRILNNLKEQADLARKNFKSYIIIYMNERGIYDELP